MTGKRSKEVQAFLDTHPTLAEIERDLGTLSEGAMQELCIKLSVLEILHDLEREGYIRRVPDAPVDGPSPPIGAARV